MKRMLDLYSQFREDKDAVRRDRLALQHELQTGLRRLALERDEKIFRFEQDRQAELRRIHNRLCREAQVMSFRNRSGRYSEKDLLAMQSVLDAHADECGDLRKAASALCHEQCQKAKEYFFRQVDALEQRTLERRLELDARESRVIASFRAAELALLDTYRKEREEKGGGA